MSKKLVITTVAMLAAALATPALAGGNGHAKKAKAYHSARVVSPAAFGNARGAVGNGYDFSGYPTSDLINRFGDRQAQGRL